MVGEPSYINLPWFISEEFDSQKSKDVLISGDNVLIKRKADLYRFKACKGSFAERSCGF